MTRTIDPKSQLLDFTRGFSEERRIRLRKVDQSKIDDRYDSKLYMVEPNKVEAYSGGDPSILNIQYIRREWGEEFTEAIQVQNIGHYLFARHCPSLLKHNTGLSLLAKSRRLKEANEALEAIEFKPNLERPYGKWYSNDLSLTFCTFEEGKGHLITA
ncbi:MAG: hypothetical protein AABY10_01200, partial [Nanoarchaeota archaeon]